MQPEASGHIDHARVHVQLTHPCSAHLPHDSVTLSLECFAGTEHSYTGIARGQSL